MLTATVIQVKASGQYYARISKQGPQTGGDVRVVEILNQKAEEDEIDFRLRCWTFVVDVAPAMEAPHA